MTKDRAKERVSIERIAHAIVCSEGKKGSAPCRSRGPLRSYESSPESTGTAQRRMIARDFMFPLDVEEHAALMLQSATSKSGRVGRRKLQLAFTEHGAIKTATVLNSPRAVEMGIYVVRAFVQLRELLTSSKELATRQDDLETLIARKVATHDQAITDIIKTIRNLTTAPEPSRRPIGFVELEERKK